MVVDEAERWHVDLEEGDRCRLLSISGELDVFTAARLDALARGLTGPARDLVVDCTHLTFVDVAGLRCLLRLRARLALDGATLTLTRPSTRLRRTLALAGSGDLLRPRSGARSAGRAA